MQVPSSKPAPYRAPPWRGSGAGFQVPIIVFLFFIFYFLVAATPAWARVCGETDLSTPELKEAFQKRSPLLPACAFFEGVPQADKECRCRDINELVRFLIIYGNFAIGGVGAIALLMFMYGGAVMLTAAGNAEKVGTGRKVLVAAVIGIIIVFSASLVVRFVVKDVLQAELAEEQKSLLIEPKPGEKSNE